jgi:(1->4)-alpha-D-glucan 1-alpha-D-glucosylmutase
MRADEDMPDPAALAELRDRAEAYMLKAVREMKLRTTWIDPHEGYEEAVLTFVRSLFCQGGIPGPDFLRDVNHVVARIARPGFWNALSRALVQFTSPGMPDLYQGDEIWNFAMVDPDNRRPVDYELREKLLDQIIAAQDGPAEKLTRFAHELAHRPEDGRIKLHVIRGALWARSARTELFTAGRYEPLEADGPAARHVFAFARVNDSAAAITIVPRLAATFVDDPAKAPVGDLWTDTVVRLPEHLHRRSWRLAFTGERLSPSGQTLAVAQALASFPVALLVADPQQEA